MPLWTTLGYIHIDLRFIRGAIAIANGTGRAFRAPKALAPTLRIWKPSAPTARFGVIHGCKVPRNPMHGLAWVCGAGAEGQSRSADESSGGQIPRQRRYVCARRARARTGHGLHGGSQEPTRLFTSAAARTAAMRRPARVLPAAQLVALVAVGLVGALAVLQLITLAPRSKAPDLPRPLPLAALPGTPRNASTDVTQAWTVGMLFHTIDQGRRIRGSVLVHKDAPEFQFKAWPVVERCNGRTCAMRGKGCRFCATGGSSCIQGVLTSGKSRAEQYFELAHGNRKWASARSFSAEADKALYLTVLLTCDLEPARAGELGGTLHLTDMPSLVLTVAPPPPLWLQAQSREQDVVCARGLFGHVDGHAVAKAVHHYVEHWRFARVVVYQIGMDDLRVAEHPDVKRQMAAGQLVMVDLRDELQRIYGGAMAADALLFSFQMGQILFKFDCLVRAQNIGARWTLHVDLDELLVPGRERVRASGSALPPGFAAMAAPLTNAAWISFGSLSVNDPGGEPCDCAPLSEWAAWLRAVAAQHSDKEWPATAPREPFDCFAKGDAPTSRCGGVAGFRKFAVRVDQEPVLPVGAGVHDVLECSVACARTNDGHVMDATDVYFRHYRCLNLPLACSEAKAGAPLLSPAQQAVVGSVEPLRSRGVVVVAA